MAKLMDVLGGCPKVKGCPWICLESLSLELKENEYYPIISLYRAEVEMNFGQKDFIV